MGTIHRWPRPALWFPGPGGRSRRTPTGACLFVRPPTRVCLFVRPRVPAQGWAMHLRGGGASCWRDTVRGRRGMQAAAEASPPPRAINALYHSFFCNTFFSAIWSAAPSHPPSPLTLAPSPPEAEAWQKTSTIATIVTDGRWVGTRGHPTAFGEAPERWLGCGAWAPGGCLEVTSKTRRSRECFPSRCWVIPWLRPCHGACLHPLPSWCRDPPRHAVKERAVGSGERQRGQPEARSSVPRNTTQQAWPPQPGSIDTAEIC